jgi:hypothetical protein
LWDTVSGDEGSYSINCKGTDIKDNALEVTENRFTVLGM